MSLAIKNAVHAALDCANVYTTKVDRLKELCANVDDVGVRATLLPHVATWFKVTLIKSERTGQFVLDKDAEQYEAARKALFRLTQDVGGKKPKSTVAAPVSKKLVAQGVTMVIEQSMTAAQFNAWVAAVRSSVTFAKN